MKKFENILVAFDLNKTLFFKSESPLPRMHDSKIKKRFFYLRPHIKELVEFLHSHQINYCFWSNMIAKNCKIFVKQLETFGLNKHCGIFDQQFCDKPQNMPQLVLPGQKIKYIKNLNKLASLFEIDVNHCILVDDSKEKNVEGCHLIHVNSYQGKQDDKQIFYIIERIKEFRKQRVNQETKVYHKLKYIEQNQYTSFQIEKHLMKSLKIKQQTKVIQKTIQKPAQKKVQKTPEEVQQENELHAQLKKFKVELVLQKQNKKSIKLEIQTLQKTIQQMSQQIKKQSEGKCLRKGDQLLVQVLMFAKNKKASQQKLQQLDKKKKQSQQKISAIKKLMREINKKLNINDEQVKQQNKNDNNGQNCQEKKNKKSKKAKKEKHKLQGQKHENNPDEVAKAEQIKNQQAKAQQ